MKKLIFALTLSPLLFASANAAPFADDAQVKATLVDLEMKSWVAWKARDGKYFDGFLSDDHVEVGGSGLSTKKEVAEFVGSSACVVKSYKLSDFKLTRFNEQTALLTYHAEQETTCRHGAVPSPVWVSSLYVKRGGKWLDALYQQTNKP